MAAPRWIPELFDSALGGVSSAVTPDLLNPTQLAWLYNGVCRGSKPATRPVFKYRLTLPTGLVQGAAYFGAQGGMGVASIMGNIYRLRIDTGGCAWEEVSLPWRNSAKVKQVWMQPTVETLVIQDGESDPILYDGSTAVRSNPRGVTKADLDGNRTTVTNPQVPRGRQMAYGNGRLWVAVNDKELVAGDIRQNIPKSELDFTETNYLAGGGSLYFPRGMTALGFIGTTGMADYGALMAFGRDYGDSIRADITSRDLWAQVPTFVPTVLRNTGCASHWSLTSVNQDLYWRDAQGGIRSIRSGLGDEAGPGNSPLSLEVSRLTDYDSKQLLGFCPAIEFDNRLIMGSSPFLNDAGGVSWKALVVLDFAPLSTMQGKVAPAYDGQWSGINVTHLFKGLFGGVTRAFAISHNDDGSNSLWEIMAESAGFQDDETVACTGGVGEETVASPITGYLETARRSFGDAKRRKRLERCDLWLSDVSGAVNLKVWWRMDNNQKWLAWDETDVCAKMGDPVVAGATTHTWKNLRPQQRPQIKSFSIPQGIDAITKYAMQTGFECQLRIGWTGRAKIHKVVLFASMLDEATYAVRDLVTDACLDNDVTAP